MLNASLLGYKFLSLEAIQAYLEPTAAGISTRWAKVIAKRYDCIVSIGYPEYAAPDHALPNASTSPFGNNFNSTVTVAPDGKILAHYRKSFLYMTDETWASEGSGFYAGVLPLRGGCRVAMGICMDINPYKFEAPFEKCEFATHAVTSGAELVVLSMAWSSLQLTSEDLKDHALQPDLATLSYWVSRFRPLQEKDTNVPTILVMSNRCGTEHDTNYAGTSTVMRLCGERVDLWEVLGKGEERCLVVDTEMVRQRYCPRASSADWISSIPSFRC